jgi:TPR repeat protein
LVAPAPIVAAAAARAIRGEEPVPYAALAPSSAGPPPLRASAGGPVAQGLTAYHDGQFDQARAIWEPLASRGDALAQFYLGGLYRVGAGVSPDPISAYVWWSLAARGGHQVAKEQLHELTAEMSLGDLVEAQRQLQAWRPGS